MNKILHIVTKFTLTDFKDTEVLEKKQKQWNKLNFNEYFLKKKESKSLIQPMFIWKIFKLTIFLHG